jgi:hypothetical protein
MLKKLATVIGLTFISSTIFAGSAWLQGVNGPSPHFYTSVQGSGWHFVSQKEHDANVTFVPALQPGESSPFKVGIILNQKTYPADFEYDLVFVNDKTAATCTYRMLHIYAPADPHIIIDNANGAHCTWGLSMDAVNYKLG